MNKRSLWAVTLLIMAVTIAACRPQAPVPPAASTPAAAPPVQQTPSKPAPSAQSPDDIAWNKVLEAARKEGVVTAYSFSLTGDIAKAAIEAFQNRYGIKLDVVGGVGATLAERIKTENNAKKYVADTFDTAVNGIIPIKELGLLVNLKDLPALKEKNVWLLEPVMDPAEGTMLQIRLTYQTTVINTTLVKPDAEPKSFLDFLDPKWKGKKLASAPPRVSWPLVYLNIAIPDIISESYLRSLGKQELLMVTTMRDEATAVARGDALAVVSTSLSTVDALVRSGAPLKAVVMKEGTISANPAVSVLKNAPHPNAARVFANWWLSPEGQTAVNKAMGVPNVRKDVPDFSSEGTRIKPVKLLPLDEEANRLTAKYVAEGRVDKWLGVDVK
ncbi:MAG: extracellular solute-binding protein [Chloroflexi bacterium]|nr:extracellular solute-binding protein [Chloroflexota bacterium]